MFALQCKSQYFFPSPQVSNVILSSTTENNIRVITVAAQFVVTNYSSYELYGWCFAVLDNEQLDQIRQDERSQHTACIGLPRNDRKCDKYVENYCL